MEEQNQQKEFWRRWYGKEILITGGTGSLGHELTKLLLSEYPIKGIRIYSRGEEKQRKMREWLKGLKLPNKTSFLIGDVRDCKRLERAMYGVDIAFHAAALKQIPTCEENPVECINTNIYGAVNVLNAALNCKVEKVINISTDKACKPVNIYGMCKATAEKLFMHGNIYSGGRNPYFSSVRWGNVIGSTGSVIPLFKEQAKKGILTITHKDMTRFWISLEEVSRFLIKSAEIMTGSEIFIPKMKSCRVIDIAKAIAPEAEIKEIGIRPGEKLHEDIIYKEEVRDMGFCETDTRYILTNNGLNYYHEFELNSLNNPNKFTEEEIRNMIS